MISLILLLIVSFCYPTVSIGSGSTGEIVLRDFTPKGTKLTNVLYIAGSKYPNAHFGKPVLMDNKDLFTLEHGKDIYTNIDIDRDQVCVKLSCCKELECSLNVTVYLFPTTNVMLNIPVKIIDENDNEPVFISPQKSIFILESVALDSTHKLPVARDKDSEKNGIDNYQLFDSTNTFDIIRINEEPFLKLIKTLDRETISSYQIKLAVSDKGSPRLTNSVDLTIEVGDDNDNTPYFVNISDSSTGNVIKVKESIATNEILYQFFAKDNDIDENADIIYNISANLSNPERIVLQKFSLKSPKEAQIMLRQSLDYEIEEERKIILVITASDNGKPIRSTSVSLTISLIDVNDNPPEVTEIFSNNINENSRIEQQLKVFTVSDRDSVSQNNVNCTLSRGMDKKFNIQQLAWNMYNLTNKIAFDYEENNFLMIRVECLDKAEPVIKQHFEFFVNVVDENDNSPQWDKAVYHEKIPESNKYDHVFKFITRVQATDRDSGIFGRLSYRISNETKIRFLNFIRIDSKTGDVYQEKPIDREKFPVLTFLITVCDNGGIRSSNSVIRFNETKLTLEITDVNDNAPIFMGPERYFKIPEDAKPNLFIGEIPFYDADEHPNNAMTLKLNYNSDIMGWFDILDNSTIIVKTEIDREKASNISILVQAVDHGHPQLTGTETIYIELLDINDNYPTLRYPKNNSYISGSGVFQSTPTGTKLVQLEAFDSDYGLNGSITFKVTKSNFSNEDMIKIDEKSGDILTKWNLYNYPDVGIYYLKISISDKGQPPLSTHVVFFINITYDTMEPANDSYMTNIVILIFIIVCGLALIVSPIAAIFWVRFRVSNESPITRHDEYVEREHLNKGLHSNEYSLINLDKNVLE